jgi:hypothetical protein
MLTAVLIGNLTFQMYRATPRINKVSFSSRLHSKNVFTAKYHNKWCYLAIYYPYIPLSHIYKGYGEEYGKLT